MAKHETTVVLKASDKTGKAFDSFKRNASQAEKATQRFTKGLNKTIEVGAKLGVAMSAASAGVLLMANNAVTTIRELQGLSAASQLSINDLRAYGAATKTVGVSLEQFADINKDVADKLGEFVADGAGPFRDFFENVPADLRMTSDELSRLAGPDVLIAVKSSMDAANLSAKEQTFILESLGNDASKLIPLLDKGGDKLNKLAEGFRNSTSALTKEDIANIESYGQSVDRLASRIKGAQEKSTAALGPFLEEVNNRLLRIGESVEWFIDSELGFGDKSRAIAKAREFTESLGEAVSSAVKLNPELDMAARHLARAEADKFASELNAAVSAAESFASEFEAAKSATDSMLSNLDKIQGIRAERSKKPATVLGALTSSSKAREALERGNSEKASELALKAAEELRAVEQETGKSVTNAEAFIKNFEQIAKEALEKSEKAQESLKLEIKVDGESQTFGFNEEGVKKAGDFTTERIKQAARKVGK